MNEIHIRTRIFSAVLFVIIWMSIGVGITFFFSSRWYVSYNARKETSQLIRMVQSEADQLSKDPEYSQAMSSKETAREYSKALIRSVRKQLQNQPYDGTFLIFNTKQKLVFPSITESSYPISELETQCRQMLVSGELVPGETQKLSLNGFSCFVSLYSFPSEYPVRGKDFIAVTQIPDVTAFWNYTGLLFAVILIFSLIIAVLATWVIAQSISAPIRDFCSQIQQIGSAEDAQIHSVYSLSELNELKLSYNRMEEKIRKADKEKKQFFQNASHDLKTPLASITGYAQAIVFDVTKEPKKAAEVILSESIRMTDLVNSILALSKMDSHALELRPVDIDLQDFLDECVETMDQIRPECEIRTDVPKNSIIRTDPDLLKRILQNLLSNCLRYADRTVRIRADYVDDSLVIFIQDDGPGFSEVDLPHIFERFYKGNGGKSGIGLSIVRSGILYLGGTVEAGNLSAPEHGACYRLSLPLHFKQ